MKTLDYRDNTQPLSLTCFKAYDVRGRLPDQINEQVAYRIGRAYARVFEPQSVVVGFDIRLSSPALCAAVVEGLRDEAVDVLDIGCCGTEEIYFATSHLAVGGGLMVTASHNPKDYNGIKFVRENSKPIHADNGLLDIQRTAEAEQPVVSKQQGSYKQITTRSAYIQHLLSYVDVESLDKLKIVANPGNGGASLVLEKLQAFLPFDFTLLHATPDGSFPNGVPNPLLEENRSVTQQAVVQAGADMGIAWDGDFDRCFFFDEQGNFIEGYYLVGLLSEFFLAQNANDVVVHDPRLYWNTQAVAKRYGTQAIQSKTGHAYMKGVMRDNDAVYGGEMSAHHYFRDFFYCDSGMIPWLLIAAVMTQTKKPLSQLVQECMRAFPVSGEINVVLKDASAALVAVEDHFRQLQPESIDKTDGISMDFLHWRFNLRKSNTEPVVRLNVESKQDSAIMQMRRDEILAMLKRF